MAWLFLQQATILLILWFDVSSFGVCQVKQTAWSSPSGHLANSRPYHEAGMISETSLPGQVTAGWSLQTGLECFEQKKHRILAEKS